MDTLKYFVLTQAIKQICPFTSYADEGLLIPSSQGAQSKEQNQGTAVYQYSKKYEGK